MLVPGSLAVLHMHVGVHYISTCTRIIVLQVQAQLHVTKENTDTYKYITTLSPRCILYYALQVPLDMHTTAPWLDSSYSNWILDIDSSL